ncbi:transcription factor HES-1-like isoform X1 [Passer domesticus]|uniref:transcription factor HES-1-like isoform X1 n=1 Tax=Passer domesticus TaxID=48849 RepID=UPI0030FE7417
MAPGRERSPHGEGCAGPRGDRRTRKPLVEKKRRARINESLRELRLLLADSEFQAKLENAEVLERTVRRVRAALERRARAAPASTPPRPPSCSTTCWSPCPSARAAARTRSRTLWRSRRSAPGPPEPARARPCPPPAKRAAPSRTRRRPGRARPPRTDWTRPRRGAGPRPARPDPCGDPGNGGAESAQSGPCRGRGAPRTRVLSVSARVSARLSACECPSVCLSVGVCVRGWQRCDCRLGHCRCHPLAA